MPDFFHNPYVFIPTMEEDGPGLCPRDPSQWPEHLRHDRFLARTLVDGQEEDVFSGRLVCRAIIQEALAVGASQTEGKKPSHKDANDGQPRTVKLFKIGNDFALPGSALRGMLSSLAEAATNSTLRVLENNSLALKCPRGASTDPGGKTHDFFRQRNPNLVPLQMGDNREFLTLAEQMFGLVENVTDSAEQQKQHGQALALASRIRVSHAFACGGTPTPAPARMAKILASPKYRYPSFYFNASEEGEFIRRDELKLSKGHFPKGRKFYLHREKLNGSDWCTRHPEDQKTINQKALIAPLVGGEFWFHVDFDNLSLLELELLCYVISPSDTFYHKLGLGKPLGLGKLKLEPVGLFFINRINRYRQEPLLGSRYTVAWKDPNVIDWPDRYRREKDCPTTSSTKSPRDYREDYRKRIEQKYPKLFTTLQAIELIGDPSKVKHPVHYPQLPSRDVESKLYKWFQENEERAGQFLRSLTARNTCNFTELPTLDRQPVPAPPVPSCWSASGPFTASAGGDSAAFNPVQIPPEAGKPHISRDIKWLGPVACLCLGRSRTQKWKFQVVGGTEQQVGTLSNTCGPEKVPRELAAGKTYQMEYLPVGPYNYEFRFV